MIVPPIPIKLSHSVLPFFLTRASSLTFETAYKNAPAKQRMSPVTGSLPKRLLGA